MITHKSNELITLACLAALCMPAAAGCEPVTASDPYARPVSQAQFNDQGFDSIPVSVLTSGKDGVYHHVVATIQQQGTYEFRAGHSKFRVGDHWGQPLRVTTNQECNPQNPSKVDLVKLFGERDKKIQVKYFLKSGSAPRIKELDLIQIF